MQLFYDPELTEHSSFLNAEESYHAAKVLRHKPGDLVHITNGLGDLFIAELITAHPGKCQLAVLEKQREPEPTGYLHLAIAPTKNNDRMEWLVEKCTEIGIQEISFFYAQNSERNKFNTNRVEKKAIAAMKQSLSAYLPKINEPVKFKKVMALGANQKFLAHYDRQNPSMQEMIKRNNDCLVLIGPEGDFSAAEIELARNSGFQTVNLGNKRLRTETAGMVACHTYALAHQ